MNAGLRLPTREAVPWSGVGARTGIHGSDVGLARVLAYKRAPFPVSWHRSAAVSR